MKINEMSITDFKKLRSRKSFQEDIGLFQALVILPTARKHDSGYRCLDYIAVIGENPICRLAGGSDVIHLDGIGGYGEQGFLRRLYDLKSIISWNMDCLPKSGLLRLWANGYDLKAGAALSSFEIYAIKKVKK